VSGAAPTDDLNLEVAIRPRIRQVRWDVSERHRRLAVVCIAPGRDPAHHLVIVPDRLIADGIGGVVRVRFDDQRDEAPPRSRRQLGFVRRSTDQYDAIISVHTISSAAVASGALSLSENYVLTAKRLKITWTISYRTA